MPNQNKSLGWQLFTSNGATVIQRIDEDEIFASDAEAIEHVLLAAVDRKHLEHDLAKEALQILMRDNFPEKMGTNEIQKMLVLSTAHISEACNDWLQDEGLDITQSIGQFVLYEGFQRNADRFPELKLLLELTHKLGCNYLMLDRDGPRNATLEQFEW